MAESFVGAGVFCDVACDDGVEGRCSAGRGFFARFCDAGGFGGSSCVAMGESTVSIFVATAPPITTTSGRTCISTEARQRNVLESLREESRGLDFEAILPRRNPVEPVYAVRVREPALFGVRRFTHDANARMGNPGATRVDNLYSYALRRRLNLQQRKTGASRCTRRVCRCD